MTHSVMPTLDKDASKIPVINLFNITHLDDIVSTAYIYPHELTL